VLGERVVVLWLFCIQPSHNLLGELLGFGTFSAHLRNFKKAFIFLVFHYSNRTFSKSSKMVTFNKHFGYVLGMFSN
jgi:hypothetical protein